MLLPIYLTVQELREITGRMKAAAQIRWLRRHGFTVLARADGKPLVSRAHFEARMGGFGTGTRAEDPEPDFRSFH